MREEWIIIQEKNVSKEKIYLFRIKSRSRNRDETNNSNLHPLSVDICSDIYSDRD